MVSPNRYDEPLKAITVLKKKYRKKPQRAVLRVHTNISAPNNATMFNITTVVTMENKQ